MRLPYPMVPQGKDSSTRSTVQPHSPIVSAATASPPAPSPGAADRINPRCQQRRRRRRFPSTTHPDTGIHRSARIPPNTTVLPYNSALSSQLEQALVRFRAADVLYGASMCLSSVLLYFVGFSLSLSLLGYAGLSRSIIPGQVSKCLASFSSAWLYESTGSSSTDCLQLSR